MMDANAIQVRIGELCHQFRLPTMGAQSVARFTAAGHGDALPTLLEVLEQEAEDRRQRRINRLRKESRLPAGKTWETFEHDRVPLSLQQQSPLQIRHDLVGHLVHLSLQGSMISLQLAVGLGMVRRGQDMTDPHLLQVLPKGPRDVA